MISSWSQERNHRVPDYQETKPKNMESQIIAEPKIKEIIASQIQEKNPGRKGGKKKTPCKPGHSQSFQCVVFFNVGSFLFEGGPLRLEIERARMEKRRSVSREKRRDSGWARNRGCGAGWGERGKFLRSTWSQMVTCLIEFGRWGVRAIRPGSMKKISFQNLWPHINWFDLIKIAGSAVSKNRVEQVLFCGVSCEIFKTSK